MKEFIKLNTDPADVIKLFPELDKPADAQKKSGESDSKKKDQENALKALTEYLLALRSKLGVKTTEAGGSQDEATGQRNVAQQLELIDTTLLKCYLQV